MVQKIAQRAFTSLMIVRASQGSEATPDVLSQFRYRKLLVPLDGSQRAECVLPAAVRLALAHDAQIELVHVVHQPDMPRRTPIGPDDTDLTEQFVARNRAEAEQYLDDVRNRLAGNVQPRVITSKNVSATLHDVAANEDVDLVLLSAHGYSGLSRLPYGSVVNGLMAYSRTPLLMVQDMEYDVETASQSYLQITQTHSTVSRRETQLVGGR